MKLLLSILILLTCLAAQAQDTWVSQAGYGYMTGADSNDCQTVAWLNSQPWGTTNPIPSGGRIRLCGPLTTGITNQGSGTSGAPITLQFEPGAGFIAPTWPSNTVLIALNFQSNIVIDGGGAGVNMQCTANGSGMAHTNDLTGIGGEGYNIVIKNMTITNLFKNIPFGASNDVVASGVCHGIQVLGKDITISNCNISDAVATLVFSGPRTSSHFTQESNLFIVNNRLFNYCHGMDIDIGGSDDGPQNISFTNLVIAGNFMDHSDLWDETSDPNDDHLDTVFIANNTDDATAILNGLRVFGNTFGPNFGNHASTGGIYVDMDNVMQQNLNAFVFNNLFVANQYGGSDGVCIVGGSNVWLVNNTAYGGGTNGGNFVINGLNSHIYNNILAMGGGVEIKTATANPGLSGANTASNNAYLQSNYFQSVWSDYNAYGTASANLYFTCILVSTNSTTIWNPGFWAPLSDWQTDNAGWPGYNWQLLHADPHSTTNMPTFVSGGYVPAASDTVTLGGTNLAAIATLYNVPQMMFDAAGNARASTGSTNWYIGAFNASAWQPQANSPTAIRW
jgi:hypothetical protein